MRTRTTYAVAFAFVGAMTLPGALDYLPVAGDPALAGPVVARVLKVMDGDTLLVRARIWLGQEVEIQVRLAGVDTPELRAPCALERAMAVQAREFLSRLVADGGIQLHDINYDKYGKRVIARVETAGGIDLAAALVSSGLGRAYAGKSRAAWCEPAENR